MKHFISRRNFLKAAGVTAAASAMAAAVPQASAGFLTGKDAAVTILYTNDVHTYIDNKSPKLTYAAIAAMKQGYVDEGKPVLLVDAGDHIQGTAYGSMDDGATIIELMNEAGYDIATLGNHEFDYGVDRLMELAAGAEFPYLSCNFTGLAAGEPVFQPYALLDYGDTTVGYVGICTPESLTKTDPTYFRDEAGEAVYGFRQGGDGQELYDCVQAAVDQARAEGADYVVAVGHLGNEGISAQWSSQAVIAHTTGIDVSLDGHSHEQYERTLPNREGKDVVLAQTGTGLTAIGQVILDPVTGEIQAELVAGYAGRDPEMEEEIAAVQAQYEEQLSQVVGSTDVALVTTDPATGEYWVRSRETNLGDFCADAYRAVMGADIAFVNGGGIRAELAPGEVTYGDILDLHPYGNALCLVEATGQQILDALEMGARKYPQTSGGFLQVSGLTYTIDAAVPSSVVVDENGAFQSVDGPRRVTGVKVGGQPLELDRVYTLASHNYMLKSGGDGYTMFQGCTLLKDETVLDNQALIRYLGQILEGDLSAYSAPGGQGRIQIAETAEETGGAPAEPEEPAAGARIYVVQPGDCLWTIARQELGGGLRWVEIYDANRDQIQDPDRIQAGMELELPA